MTIDLTLFLTNFQGMLSVDSGLGSDVVIHPSWFPPATTSFDQCSTASTDVPRLDDFLSPLDCGSRHDNTQSQKTMLQDFKVTVPQNTSTAAATNSMLRSMLWSSWPLSPSAQNAKARFAEQSSFPLGVAQFLGMCFCFWPNCTLRCGNHFRV